FMGLPDELISDIISILDMKDRLRARVNKRLDKIELESKYHIKNLHINDFGILEPRIMNEKMNELNHRYSLQFPLLDLPDDPISNIFYLLPMKDRLRARVNKRLNKIETESKFHVNELEIEEVRILEESLRYVNPLKRSYSTECIRKISRNTSIETLQI
ncbi:hypothetical protein PMAYCL1PPCAC_19625, partial [Pristionchus mayeri]